MSGKYWYQEDLGRHQSLELEGESPIVSKMEERCGS
jgi:hypothetical protein